MAGETDIPKSVPLPTRVTTCGLPEALSVTENEPEVGPGAVGADVICTVQLAPAASEVEQVFVPTVKLPNELVFVICNDALPVFVKVRTWAELVVLSG